MARQKWESLNAPSQASKRQKLREVSSLLRLVTKTACKSVFYFVLLMFV